MDETKLSAAAGSLRATLIELESSHLWGEIVTPRAEVLARFQPIFDRTHIPNLTADEFRPFLYFDNNHHWTGLHRQVNRITDNMDALRKALLIVTDEGRPIAERLDEVGGAIVGLGKAIITAILTVAFPDKYGVWNATSQEALVQLDLWPTFRRGTSFGEQYTAINAILIRLAQSLGIDLWTLDAVFWQLIEPEEAPSSIKTEDTPAPQAVAERASVQFGLERHLHDFLFDNWNRTTVGKDWALYTVSGDPEAGYEFACAAGKIDLLAQHRREKKWLVIELKKNTTSDAAVGQVLRYMGWVRLNLAEPQDEIHGVIIAPAIDRSLAYAITPVGNLSAMSYEVDFRLIEAPRALAAR
jgi:hypothetical protein